jgi:hypothetical protein
MEGRPFTQDSAHLTVTSAALLRKLNEYRRSESTKSLTELSAAFLAPDEYDAELQLISYVLAYLKVAYKRFADMIPMRVEEKIQSHLADHIQKKMMDKFLGGEGCEERCRAYLEDSPDVIARRREYIRKLDILRAADQEVKKIQAC